MEMIIKASGVSVGAVYRYFKGKDDVIAAAFATGTAGLIEAVEPVLAQSPPPRMPELVGQLLETIRRYQAGGPVDLGAVALHGWSHSQSDPALQAVARRMYGSLRDGLVRVCREWQAQGQLDDTIDPKAVAELLFSVLVGFIAQRALIGDVDVDAHVAGLRALTGSGAVRPVRRSRKQ